MVAWWSRPGLLAWCRLARATGLPMFLHMRDATDDFLSILHEHRSDFRCDVTATAALAYSPHPARVQPWGMHLRPLPAPAALRPAPTTLCADSEIHLTAPLLI